MAVFVLVFASGDPASTMIPLDARPEDVVAIRAHYGLDQPIYVQYALFVKNALRGDFGDSFRFKRSSLDLVLERLPATFSLAGISLTLAVVAAFPLGMLSALKRGTFVDFVTTSLSLLAISVPQFWLGILLILVFAEKLGWLPPTGKEGLRSYILPAVTMACAQIGTIVRLLRCSMLENLSMNYVTVARAKGLTERAVVYGHALKNALIPTVTVIGLDLGKLIGGSVILESVFAWPGVGWLLREAIATRDLPLLRADVLVMAVVIVGINFLVDISYSILDPRIRE